MTEGALNAALKRLEAATATLEAASARVHHAHELGAEKDTEIALLADDRARLAEQLDESAARALRLEHSNRDAARRLDGAISTIRDVLAHADREG
jgi:septal ring factor EnvC (AmiA/AmiB activator)